MRLGGRFAQNTIHFPLRRLTFPPNFYVTSMVFDFTKLSSVSQKLGLQHLKAFPQPIISVTHRTAKTQRNQSFFFYNTLKLCSLEGIKWLYIDMYIYIYIYIYI